MNGSEWSFKLKRNDSGYLGSLEIRYIGSEPIPEHIAFQNDVTSERSQVISFQNMPVVDGVFVYQLLKDDVSKMLRIFKDGNPVTFFLLNGRGSFSRHTAPVPQLSSKLYIMNPDQQRDIYQSLKELSDQ